MLNLDHYRALSSRALERWVPRKCSEEWLTEVTGFCRFRWDVNAIQLAFNDPLHELAGVRSERTRPILAAALIEAGGLDPEPYSSLLAALELQFLSVLMAKHFYNGKTISEATPVGEQTPLSVLATVGYTARQFAPVLASRHTPSLRSVDRSWLAYRFGRVLILGGVGVALSHTRWHAERKLMDANTYLEHLHGYCCPLTFQLSVDCAAAALGIREQNDFAALERAGAHAGIAYQLAMEANHHWIQDSESPTGPPEVELSYLTLAARQNRDDMRPPVAMLHEFNQICARERSAAYRELASVAPPLRDTFEAFMAAVIDPILPRPSKVSYAQ